MIQNLEGNISMTITSSNLTWINVGIALAFILFDIAVSTVFRLGIGLSLLIAALRCISQLALVAAVLHRVFETKNPWVVALICLVLNFLGTFEAVINRSPRRFHYMFPAVLVAMLGSTIPISIIGTKFAMAVTPFWTPIQFIPIVGMLCGSSMSGIVIAVSYVLKEFQENKDKIETYLAFGATRVEACRPIAIQALKLALTPPINSMRNHRYPGNDGRNYPRRVFRPPSGQAANNHHVHDRGQCGTRFSIHNLCRYITGGGSGASDQE